MIGNGREPLDAAAFCVRLRRACFARGILVSPTAAIDILNAVASFNSLGPQDLYLSARAICMHRPEELVAFDEAFTEALHFELDLPDDDLIEEISNVIDEIDADLIDENDLVHEGRALAYSRVEQLRERDIADCDDEELAAISEMLDQLLYTQALRRRRRSRTTDRHSQIVDIRSAIARAHTTQGEIVDLAFRRRRVDLRHVVFLLDVSGSMEPYVATFLRVIYGVAHCGVPTEAFSLGTRLTRLTRALLTHDADAFSQIISSMVSDLAGGTRLGEAIETFNRYFGIRGMARTATVVVFSDGLDRGDPELLRAQMERLHRVAYRVIWVNPLKGTEGYAPLARGMIAALPAVDNFVSGHTAGALIELVALLQDETVRSGTSLTVGRILAGRPAKASVAR